MTPPVEGADLRAALEASCLRGACTGKVETGSNEGKKSMDPALALRLQLKFAPRPNSSAPAQELPESTKSPPLHRGTSSVWHIPEFLLHPWRLRSGVHAADVGTRLKCCAQSLGVGATPRLLHVAVSTGVRTEPLPAAAMVKPLTSRCGTAASCDPAGAPRSRDPSHVQKLHQSEVPGHGRRTEHKSARRARRGCNREHASGMV